MKSFNGHRSWNAWNVSLWIDNDYSTYMSIVEICKTSRSLNQATRRAKNILPARTPDGATNNALCVRLAIEDLYNEFNSVS